jgi:hypothetical protein
MVRAVCRATLFLGVVLALWTFSCPASASAPLCDDRGATALAHPPPLEAPDVAIERARTSSSCPLPGDLDGDLPLCERIAPAHHPVASTTAAADPALPVALAALPVAGDEGLDFPPEPSRPGCGVRVRVERPPRG